VAARDDEEVQVAVAPEPGRDGRPEQVGADRRVTQDVTEEPDACLKLTTFRFGKPVDVSPPPS